MTDSILFRKYFLAHTEERPAEPPVCRAKAFYCKDPRYTAMTRRRIREVLERMGYDPIFYEKTLDGEVSVNMLTEEGRRQIMWSLSHTQGAQKHHGHPPIEVVIFVDHEDCRGRGGSEQFGEPGEEREKTEKEFCLQRLLEDCRLFQAETADSGYTYIVVLMYVNSHGAWVVEVVE